MRKKTHTQKSKKSITQNLYHIIRENGGWKNWTMEIIEEYPCSCREELVIRERYWYEELKPTLNIYKPFTSYEEEKESKKKMYEANRELMRQRDKEYYKANKETIKQKKREHYEANRDAKKQQSLEHYEANKESINQKRRKNKNIE